MRKICERHEWNGDTSLHAECPGCLEEIEREGAVSAAMSNLAAPYEARIKELESKLDAETQRSKTGWQLANEMKADRDALVLRLGTIRALVDEQAEDEGLWAMPIPPLLQPITEAYLQQELRRLHAAVEGVVEKL